MVLLPVFVYLLLAFPYFGLVPFHDGNTEFQIAYNFFAGKYLSNWQPYHPPFKPILESLLFFFFGYRAYSFVGFFLGIAGIIAFYYTAKKLCNDKVALLSSFLLATSGLYLANAAFTLNDFLETVCILLAFCFYVRSRLIWYAVFGSLAVMAKESAIILPLSVCLIDFFFRKKITFSHLVPFVAFQGWLVFLWTSGHQLWNSWNFSQTSSQGSAITLLYNVLTLHFFNTYLEENLLHLFIFNFNWFFSLLFLLTLVVYRRKLSFLRTSPELQVILVFFVLYCLVILSFETYTINRYILPLLPCIYLFVAYGLTKMRFRFVCIGLTIIVVVASLLASIDPISNLFWKHYTILGQTFYLNGIDGPDGITYNLQFLELNKKRDIIVMHGDCQRVLPQLDYDKRTFALYGLQGCK